MDGVHLFSDSSSFDFMAYDNLDTNQLSRNVDPFDIDMNYVSHERVFAIPDNEKVVVKTGPPPEVWEYHRPTIKKLYLDENRTLKQVMAIMPLHGLNGTEKMYKDHITLWKLDKKRKRKHMIWIAQKKIQRDAIAKASLFRVRNQQVDVEEVKQYFKRRGMRSLGEALRISSLSQPSTRSDVECLTPPPVDEVFVETDGCGSNIGSAISPIYSHSMSHSITTEQEQALAPIAAATKYADDRFLQTHRTVASFAAIENIVRPQIPPSSLYVPEKMLIAVRVFVNSSLDRSGHEYSSQEAHQWVKAQFYGAQFHNLLRDAVIMLQHQHYASARLMLAKACGIGKRVIDSYNAFILFMIFSGVIEFRDSGFFKHFESVLQHLKSLADLSGPSALGEIFGLILQLDDNIDEACLAAWKYFDGVYEHQSLRPLDDDHLNSIVDRSVCEAVKEVRSLEATSKMMNSLSIYSDRGLEHADRLRYVRSAPWGQPLLQEMQFDNVKKLGKSMCQHGPELGNEAKSFPPIPSDLEIGSESHFYQYRDGLANPYIEFFLHPIAEHCGEDEPETRSFLNRCDIFPSSRLYKIQWVQGKTAYTCYAKTTRYDSCGKSSVSRTGGMARASTTVKRVK